MEEHTTPDETTIEAERSEAEHPHSADRLPTPEESAAAVRGVDEAGGDPRDVAEHEKEMNEIGAHVKGEGEID